MRLYNTLTRQIEELKFLDPPNVSIYTCGPTVYNHVHIGNIASFIYADTLKRTLKANGFRVKHAMNFTDVDDKTITRSKEVFPDKDPLHALQKLTKEYSIIFLENLKAVGIDVNSYTFVKATTHIKEMQDLVRKLHQAGFAYIADDGIYFSIEKYKQSGKKYGQLTEITSSSTSEARIQNDEYDKESAHDFALWKKHKPGEPVWEFKIDGEVLDGRPGWHLECSAMSNSMLGQPFDIHTGGVDLIFPHHENEIAQSTAGNKNSVYAAYFMHSEHFLIDGNKMSKSLNNFITVEELISKGYDPIAFRLLTLQGHYKSQVHFSFDNLTAAQNRLQDLRSLAALRHQPRKHTHDSGTFALEDIANELAKILAEDLNTPKALAFLSQVSTQLQTVHIEKDMVDHFEKMILGIDEMLGLNLMSLKDITHDQKNLLKERESARANQEWGRSDSIRAQLESEGVGVRDATHGPIWFPL